MQHFTPPAHPYATIRATALHLAARVERHSRSREHAKALRHIALDCSYAEEGCMASAESVSEYLDLDGRLSSELAFDAWKAELEQAS